MAKKYDELPVEKWNTAHFRDYTKELHKKTLGIEYQPAGGWQREAGLLGDIVGTQKKAAKYDKALIKEFITRCIETYTPSAQYPGINFMFMWTWRKNILQQLEIEHKRKNAEEAAADVDYDDLEEWL